MWFWWFMLACDLLIPAIMILTGRMMWKHCPKRSTVSWVIARRAP